MPIITMDKPVRTGLLEHLFARALLDSILDLYKPAMKTLCYGCHSNRPSQKDHDFCLNLTMTKEEKVDLVYHQAYRMIKPSMLFERWLGMATMAMDPEPFGSEMIYMRECCEERENNNGCCPQSLITIVKLLNDIKVNLKLNKTKM